MGDIAARERFFMNSECDFTRELVSLASAALRGDEIDKGQLCRAAIRVIDNPPEDDILAALADPGHQKGLAGPDRACSSSANASASSPSLRA
jgi:hypothetical protein